MSQNFEAVFDSFFESLTWAWGTYSTLVVARREDRLAIDEYVGSQRLSVWNGLPSQVQLADRLNQLSNDKSATLKVTIFGGEALTRDVLDLWKNFCSDCEVVNSYGPAEATIACIEYTIPREDIGRYKKQSIAIGSALPGIETRIVDPTLQVASEVGELCVRGQRVFEGYDDPADNFSRFYRENQLGRFEISHEWSIDDWYRTGDLVSSEDGVLFFDGRIGREVKVKGARVDLSEVERVLSTAPEVVRARASLVDGVVVAAVEVPVGILDQVELNLMMLRDYARPRSIVTLKRFPTLASGKIDGVAIDQLLLSRRRPDVDT
jgi:non-ribosomal peptide synthetase component F